MIVYCLFHIISRWEHEHGRGVAHLLSLYIFFSDPLYSLLPSCSGCIFYLLFKLSNHFFVFFWFCVAVLALQKTLGDVRTQVLPLLVMADVHTNRSTQPNLNYMPTELLAWDWLMMDMTRT